MADLEVVKHTKNVLQIVRGKRRSIWHKVSEIGLEIGIIVFAVTVSIWLHGVSEQRHEQADVRTFLLGLKEEMRADIVVVGRAVKTLETSAAAYEYLLALDPATMPGRAAFDKAYSVIALPTFGVPLQRAHYEGFKSSGKLGHIEDKKLLKKIVEVYEYSPFTFRTGEQIVETNRQALKAYLDETVDVKGDAVRFSLLVASKGKRLLAAMNNSARSDYAAVIKREELLIREIDTLYPDGTKSLSQ